MAFFKILWLASKPGASRPFPQFAGGVSAEGAGACSCAGLEQRRSRRESGCGWHRFPGSWDELVASHQP